MSYIKSDFIERVKEKADIRDVFEALGHTLEKKGSRLFCLSPFHTEKTPSCCVDTVKQRFTDFSSDKNGDAITLLMESKGFSYPEAVKWLADHYGMSVEYEDEEKAKRAQIKQKEKENLRPLLTSAQNHFRQAFKDLPEEHAAKIEVLERREYTDELIIDWGIGFAPGGTFIYDKVNQNEAMLKKAQGLFLVGEKYDKYWDRVTYPIHDKNGLLVGFAGRDVSGKEDTAKWINPAATQLYNKDKIWFAMHRAAHAIRKKNEAWILEGYNDVIAWHRFGIINSIAACGTSITNTQIQDLKKLTSNVIFCMDDDAAGAKSTLKNIGRFMAYGFTAHVVKLNGLDPDDFVREHAEELSDIDTSLEPLVTSPDYKMNGFKYLMESQLDTTDEFSRGETARSLCKVIATIPDEDSKEIYQGWLAKESKVKETQIKGWVKNFSERSTAEEVEKNKYTFPPEVDVRLEDVKSTIENYGLFMAGDRIYILEGEENNLWFSCVSNFSIEIIQHMQDEKMPMKLVKIRNTAGDERIFDVPSDEMNTPMSFDNAMTRHGNFLWTGGRREFQKLRRYLFDEMGVGTKIEVLGWQPQNF